MSRNIIYYDKSWKFLRALANVPPAKLAILLSLQTSEIEDMIHSFDKLLSAYVQVYEDLNELQFR